MKRTQAILGSVLAALALASCGGDEAEESTASELASYLPDDSFFAGSVDVAEVRSQLELPEDANPAPESADEITPFDDPASALQLSMGVGFAQYFDTYSASFDPAGGTPLDGSRIQAAASNMGTAGEPVSIIKTEEPFDEIADGLAEDGYTEDGDVFVAGDDTAPGAAGVVRDGGDGIVIFADEVATTDEIVAKISGDGEPNALAEVTRDLDGPIRIAVSGADEDDDEQACLTGFGISQNPGGTEGEVAVATDEEASVDRFDPASLESQGLQVGEPESDGSAITASYKAEPDPGGQTAGRVVSSASYLGMYECE